LEGFFSRAATATVDSASYRFSRRGWARLIVARDEAGAEVGRYEGRLVASGGVLSWRGRDLTLRRASVWRDRFALADGDRDLVVMEVRPWGRKPLTVHRDEAAAGDPALVLFAVYVARALAGDDAAAVAAASSSAATSA
jgi:hypothetical protein